MTIVDSNDSVVMSRYMVSTILVSLSRDNHGTSVPLSRGTRQFWPVRKPSNDYSRFRWQCCRESLTIHTCCLGTILGHLFLCPEEQDNFVPLDYSKFRWQCCRESLYGIDHADLDRPAGFRKVAFLLSPSEVDVLHCWQTAYKLRR